MKNLFYNVALLLFSLLVLSGCGATGPTGISLTEEGQYVKSPIKNVAISKMELPDKRLKLLSEKMAKRLKGKPLVMGVANFPDDTGTPTMSEGSLVSGSTRQWVTGALVRAGISVLSHADEMFEQHAWIVTQRTAHLLNLPIKEELKAKAKINLNNLAERMLEENPFPSYILRGTISRFDRNIRSGGLNAELGSALDIVAMNLGFEGIYQVSEMAILFEILDEHGRAIHSFEVNKQLIASERSIALLNTVSDVLDDDISVSATPKLRVAEPVHAAQKMIAEEGSAIAIEWLLENKL